CQTFDRNHANSRSRMPKKERSDVFTFSPKRAFASASISAKISAYVGRLKPLASSIQRHLPLDGFPADRHRPESRRQLPVFHVALDPDVLHALDSLVLHRAPDDFCTHFLVVRLFAHKRGVPDSDFRVEK